MRMQRPTIALLIGSALCGASFLSAGMASAATLSSPTAQETERLLKDRDLGPLAKKLGAWFADAEAGKDTLESEQDFREALTKVNEKRLRGGDLLSSPSDLGMTIFLANNYAKKALKRVNGKVTMQSEKFGDFDVEYAIWSPTKYKGKEPVTLVLSIPEEGKNPQEHIQQTWVDGGFKETVVIASPKMPGDSKTWTGREGRRAILLTLRFVTKTWAVDANRVFIGGRGRGGARRRSPWRTPRPTASRGPSRGPATLERVSSRRTCATRPSSSPAAAAAPRRSWSAPRRRVSRR